MDIQKRNRLIAAATVTVVLLLVVLVAILIYQLVVIVDLKNKRQELNDEYDKIMQEIEDTEDDIDYYSNVNNLYIWALKNDIIGK